MGKITIQSIEFNTPPIQNQVVRVYWRLTASLDIDSSYTRVEDAVVGDNGVILNPNPYVINDLPNLAVTLKFVNECDGYSFKKGFFICPSVADASGSLQGQCAIGFTLSEDGTYCYKVTESEPVITNTNFRAISSVDNTFGNLFSRIYREGYTANSISQQVAPASDVYFQMTSNFWNNEVGDSTGPVNRYGVWIDENDDGAPDSLPPGTLVTFSYLYNNAGASRIIYLGFATNLPFSIKLNGVAIVSKSTSNAMHYRIFHIIPIQIVSGLNYFNFVLTADGTAEGVLAAAIYDSPPNVIRDATVESNMVVLFRSDELRGDIMDIASCPVNLSLDISAGIGEYLCKSIQIQSPS